MKKNFNIRIEKSAVLDIIKNVTAYIGAKTPDATGNIAYDRVAIFDEDSAILTDLWNLSVAELLRLCNRYVTNSTNSGDVMTISFSLPDNCSDQAQLSMINNAKSFLSYCMLVKWCDMSNREDAKTYEDNMQVSAQAIKEALYERSTYSRTAIINKTSWK